MQGIKFSVLLVVVIYLHRLVKKTWPGLFHEGSDLRNSQQEKLAAISLNFDGWARLTETFSPADQQSLLYR